MLKAQYEMLKGDVVGALQDLNSAVLADKCNFNAYYYMAYLQMAEGKYKQAIVHLEMALQVQPKRPLEQGIKKQFHQVEQGLSNLKMNLLGAKDTFSSAITFGQVHQHVTTMSDTNTNMKERIKKLEIKHVSPATMLNARAVCNMMQGFYFKAIPDLLQLVLDTSIKPGIARLRHMYALASTYFFAQQWNDAKDQIATILQFKGLPIKYRTALQLALHYCQYKLGGSASSDFPLYMRFLPDDMLTSVFSYFDIEAVHHYLRVSGMFKVYLAQRKSECVTC